jgi:uncharacterized protein
MEWKVVTMNNMLFFLVILLANIVQGITGFAGTILAMPPSILLVGYSTAKPILNVLGILSGLYVLCTNKKHINRHELVKIIIIMGVGIFGGILLKSLFIEKEMYFYKLLGFFILLLSLRGLYHLVFKRKKQKEFIKKTAITMILDYMTLILAGIIHGMFVSGGPLLIGYLSKKIKEKSSFRATISTVWVILNVLLLFDDYRQGLWDYNNLIILSIATPFLILGMFIGSKLYAIISQVLFMKVTYILLFVSGATLVLK